MHISELDYELPEELIAQKPLAQRDASRLLVVDGVSGAIEDHRFSELPALVPPSVLRSSAVKR